MFIRIKFFQCLVRVLLISEKLGAYSRNCFFQAMSLTVGIVFMGQKFNQDGIQNINGANFNVMMNLSFGNAVGTVHVIETLLYLPSSGAHILSYFYV